MFDSKTLEKVTEAICEGLPSDLKALQKDLKKNIGSSLQAVFSKMDLVTAEQFKIQKSVLTKTRKKLDALEKQVAELEEKLVNKK